MGTWLYDLFMRPIIFHVSIDSIIFQPICPSMGLWFTYGSLVTIVIIISFFMYFRNKICSVFATNFQHVTNLTTINQTWNLFKTNISFVSEKIKNFLTK